MVVGGINAGEELEGRGIQLSAAFLEVFFEMFAIGDVLVLLLEVVDIIAVNSAHHLQGLLAALDPLCRDLSAVAEVGPHLGGHLMGDDLVGQHGDLLSEVDGHGLIGAQSPEDQFFHDGGGG